jgi:peroxiredoxin
MHDGKENFKEFMKTIKEKVRDWKSMHLWTKRIFVYSGLFLLVISVGAILFAKFNLFHTDADSARYMLSALVQSQAAIVAIVITLTLIAVQLTASAYSPRVIDIFKKNPDMWILLGCYGVSIFYGFIVLKLVEGVEGENVSQSAIWSLGSVSISFESCVSLAYWLGAFTFVALFPYMLDVINLLKPESIIKRLAIKITKDKILNPKEDPIQPIVDIIHGSIMKYDLETTRGGLKTVTDQVLKIISRADEEKISKHFCNHLTRVSRLAISREDVESTVEVIENLKLFGRSTAEGFEDATLRAAWSLGNVGKNAVEKGFDGVTVQAVESLEDVKSAAAEKGLEYATRQAALSLGEIGIAATEKRLEEVTLQAAWSLEKVGIAATEKRLEEVTLQTALSLEKVGIAVTEKGLEKVTRRAVFYLEKVGIAAAEKELEEATDQAAMSLGEVGIAAAEKELEEVTDQTALSLEKVGVAAAEKGLEEVTRRAVFYLEKVGIAATEKGFEEAALQAALSLEKVGIAATEKGLEKATERTALSLATLTILNEEIVKNKIQNYESILEEQYRDSFQKFMKIYEQKLEKLRAEKSTQKKNA